MFRNIFYDILYMENNEDDIVDQEYEKEEAKKLIQKNWNVK